MALLAYAMPYKDKEQQRQYMRDYRKNKMTAEQKKKHNERVYERQKEIHSWYKEYKKTLSCNRCSEDDPCCLEFHHKNPSEKDFLISQAWIKGYSIERIIKKIAKCEVLCANCHRKEHHYSGV